MYSIVDHDGSPQLSTFANIMMPLSSVADLTPKTSQASVLSHPITRSFLIIILGILVIGKLFTRLNTAVFLVPLHHH
jgi:hypothetical protein